jgi:hypothetical protein
MMKIPLSIMLFFLGGVCCGQIKDTASPSYLAGLMKDVGYNFRTIDDSLYKVPFEGDTLKQYEVNVLHFEDMVIVFVNLSKAAMAQHTPVVLDKGNLEKLMLYNIHFDYLKFGIEQSNGELFVRVDIYTSGLNAKTLRKFVDQVGRAANEIYPEMIKKN